MALSQDRYISIKSTNAGDPEVTDRELGGLAFTYGKGWKRTVKLGDATPVSPWGAENAVVIHSATQATKYFTSDSDEVKAADRYFSYVSVSGTAPTTMTFIRMSVTNGTSVSAKCGVTKVGTSSLSASVSDSAKLWAKAKEKTTEFTFGYDGSNWLYSGNKVTLSEYGIEPSGTAVSGDVITAIVSNQLIWKKDSDGTEKWFDLNDSEISSPTLETAETAIKRVDTDTNNFGSFMFVDTDSLTCKDFRDVAVFNAGKNYKYLFSVSCEDGQTGEATDNTKMNAVSTSNFKAYLSNGDVEEEFKTADGVNGTSVTNGCDKFSALMPMSLFGATDYNGVNTATNYMFKQFTGETATVSDDDVADLFDEANINYYGLVQINGQRKAFFQPGVNSDGENTAVYCNEIWLKSRISTDVMNLMLSTEMIPANEDGELMLYSVIAAAADKGKSNGMIEIGKTLTDTQKAKVYQLTGISDAWFTVQQTGYYLIVKIEPTGTGKYKAVYKLIYSKGDAIIKVEGSDILI